MMKIVNQVMNSIKREINIKFRFIKKSNLQPDFRILDVGAGNKSASKTKKVFPSCNYYGLDIDKSTNYSINDFALMNEFYVLDLTKLNYNIIPDNYFDYINMAHVIEHLYNGDLVIPGLINKLKEGGFFYIEYPSIKSLKLPSMYGTLNFHDDPTHVRLYSINELKKVFEANNCTVIHSGTRRNWYYIFLLPIRVIISLIEIRKLRGNIFWDILGFAEFLYVKKGT
jgi:SAM-dependent methyltransferase